MPPDARVFLSAKWRDLVMLNYEVDPVLLRRYVPPGTELDSFDGKTYVSLVGFRFLRTKMFGVCPIPFHSNFDEINLRFYVRRSAPGEIRRGVVFIAEIVPLLAVAQIARRVYGENYICLPMKHRLGSSGPNCNGRTAEYSWRLPGAWCTLHASAATVATPARSGSIEQFITEHYWGYTAQRSGPSLEYHVSHVPWNVWHADSAGFEGDSSSLYGTYFARVVRRPPDSAFIADGSSVSVFAGQKIS